MGTNDMVQIAILKPILKETKSQCKATFGRMVG